MSRTYRREYTGSKKHSKGCRSHGNCSYCLNNRKYKDRLKRLKAQLEITKYMRGEE